MYHHYYYYKVRLPCLLFRTRIKLIYYTKMNQNTVCNYYFFKSRLMFSVIPLSSNFDTCVFYGQEITKNSDQVKVIRGLNSIQHNLMERSLLPAHTTHQHGLMERSLLPAHTSTWSDGKVPAPSTHINTV